MKKYLAIALILLCIGFVVAQETGDDPTTAENYVQPGETKIITQDLSSDNIADLQHIQARFCNNDEITKNLDLELRPGKRAEICVILANQGSKSIDVTFGFSAGSLKDGAPICQSDMSYDNDFSKYISPQNKTELTIPAGGTSIQKFRYAAPKSATDTTLGCFAFKLAEQGTIGEGKMFLIIPRKVGYIYVHTTGNAYHLGRWDDTKHFMITNKIGILRGLVIIIALYLAWTIFQTIRKKESKPKKKK